MGTGSFDAKAYRAYSASTVGKSTDDIYTSRSIHADLNPLGVKLRESRDSADSPQATPIIIGLDVTGSMGMLADVIARKGLGTLFEGILSRKPVPNPHMMFMAIGDANYDLSPLQVSQFEADNRIVEQLTMIHVEHGGGGNSSESYQFPWYFAAHHTAHDSIEKRGKRGYLFTIGDEEAPPALTRAQIKQFVGADVERDLTTAELLESARRMYDVFHIVIEEGSHARQHLDRVLTSWTALLGQHVIRLSDHTKLAETIVSAIEVAEGVDAGLSASGWGGATAAIVNRAVSSLPRGRAVPALGGPR